MIEIIINLLVYIYLEDKQIPAFLNKLLFLGRLEEDSGVTVSFIAEKQPKIILIFLMVTE